MYTIPAEDEAFPHLQELNEILTRLLELPLNETLDESLIEYFFTGVFPTVCQKIIRSRYFKYCLEAIQEPRGAESIEPRATKMRLLGTEIYWHCHQVSKVHGNLDHRFSIRRVLL